MPPKKAKVEDTAATGRPRRTAAVANNAPAATTSKKRSQAAAQIKRDVEPPKKRGRHAKGSESTKAKPEPEDAPADAPKKRGRTSKAAAPAKVAEKVAETPKKAGRPSKAAAAATDGKDAAEPANAPASTKKRGRPAKVTPAADAAETGENADVATEPAKKRGRVAKTAPAKPAPAVPEKPTPKKRGRPPKGGETTKDSADDPAAADQLESELVEEAAHAEPSSKPHKAAAEAQEASTGPQYWLMKAEQEDRNETTASGKIINTKFTIDDLRAKKVPEPWDGVRNLQAAKYMRAMRAGDLAFFYASQGKAGRKPGITGVMEVMSEAVPDPTVSDPDAYGYVEKEADRGKWCVVHVEFRKKLSSPVGLKELQQYQADTAVLGKMQLLKQMRLSVSRVTKEEWNFIVDNLIEGYEENDDVNQATTDGQ